MDHPEAAKRTAHVQMAYGFGVETQRAKYLEGYAPDETPYGYHHARELGWNTTHSTDKPESAITSFFRKSIKRLLGFDLVHAYRNRELIRAADIVWTHEENSYLAVVVLPYLIPGMKRPRIIAQTIWLFNVWQNVSAPRRWMLKKLLRRVDVMTFHTQRYLDLAETIVPGVPKRQVQFGISGDTFPFTLRPPTLHQPIRLLSMGHDSTRDWKTLLHAFGGDDRFELRIVCRWVTDAMVAPYPNVQCVRNPTMQGFRDLYNWADIVIVTMFPNLFSGITVAMEAISMGVPVLSSDTGGVSTSFDATEVLYVPPVDPTALRDRVAATTAEELDTFSKRAQARFLAADNTSRGLARRYVEISNKILDADAAKP